MKFRVHFARVATVIGMAAALGAALMSGVPAAQAAPSGERVFFFQPDGTAVEAPPGTDLRAATRPYYRWVPTATLSDCKAREMCVWIANHYSGVGLFMGGDLAWCEGFRFEHTLLQDHTYSIWNSVTGGPSSIWNRFSDGSYRYTKYGLLQPGYHHDTEFSYIMDAWAFDPANTCTTEYLFLYQVKQP